jgi:hypothetical protein
MPATTRSIRLNIDQAAGEFDLDGKTLRRRIRAGGIVPGEDGKFSIAQICAAVFGDYRAEKTREARENADRLALENEKRRGALLDADAVYKHYEGVFVVYRAKTLASSMSDDEKEELLHELRGLKAKLFTE